MNSYLSLVKNTSYWFAFSKHPISPSSAALNYSLLNPLLCPFLSKLVYIVPYVPLFLQVQAVSAQGVGNYSEPSSFTVESFPLAYTGAIVAAVVSLAITTASVIVLVCLIWKCYTIRRCVLCVRAYVRACVHACVLFVVKQNFQCVLH